MLSKNEVQSRFPVGSLVTFSPRAWICVVVGYTENELRGWDVNYKRLNFGNGDGLPEYQCPADRLVRIKVANG